VWAGARESGDPGLARQCSDGEGSGWWCMGIGGVAGGGARGLEVMHNGATIIKIVLISRTIFGAAPLFWPNGPCIQLEYIRDAS
jgi:hypothetical protein